MPSYAYSMHNTDGCLVEVVATEAANDDAAIAMLDTLPAPDVAEITLRQGSRMVCRTRLAPG